MDINSRTSKGGKNIFFSFFSYLVHILLEFINRTIFIHILNVDYLGIHGLFGNILTILSLAELGVGSAMNFALYKPLAVQDNDKIKSLMQLYRSLYNIIGSIILVVGLIFLPFLPFLIKDSPKDIDNLYYYFIIYVLNTTVLYFWFYKK